MLFYFSNFLVPNVPHRCRRTHSCLPELPDRRLVKQRARQLKHPPLHHLLPQLLLLTFRYHPLSPHHLGNVRVSRPIRVPLHNLGFRVDGQRDKRSLKPLPPLLIPRHCSSLGGRGRLLPLWRAPSKSGCFPCSLNRIIDIRQ